MTSASTRVSGTPSNGSGGLLWVGRGVAVGVAEADGMTPGPVAGAGRNMDTPIATTTAAATARPTHA